MTNEAPMNIDLYENAERALRMVREAKFLSYDIESTGVDWRCHSPIGYVIGAPDPTRGTILPEDVVYVPVRHGGGGNLPGARPMVSPTEGFEPHPWETALADAFNYRNNHSFPDRGRIIGHNTKFDVHFSANAGVMLGRRLACTQNQEAMLDEYARSYSLSACAEKRGVTAKKGEELYAYLASLFGGPPERGQMANYWRLAGNDPLGYDYATGDGVTTYELYWEQEKKIQEENLGLVADMENDLIWTVFRMERRGIKVDMSRVEELRSATEARIRMMLESFPLGFNVRSPAMMKSVMEEAGFTNWPKTEKGNPSFTEKWLKGNDLGKKVIEIRQASNLINSFVNPLAERHVWQGRVHASLNQMKSDDKGTISGRFSCDSPNLQQVPKRVKEIAKPFRRLFVADEGYTFWERDFSQCFVAGTQVSVPASPEHPEGTVNIEDIKIGQLVYSYDFVNEKLVLRPVTWAGQTGVKKVVRLKWRAGSGDSPRWGEVTCTPDHVFYTYNGKPIRADEIKNAGVVRMRALSRFSGGQKDRPVWLIRSSGCDQMQEHRFVFEDINGYAPEHVHHKDGNNRNNSPDNLEGLDDSAHRMMHRPNDVNPEDIVRLLNKGMYKTEVAKKLGCTVHAVEYWRQKLLPGHVVPKGAGRIDVNEVYYWLDKGLNYADVALQLGCAAPTVRYHALRRGKAKQGRETPPDKVLREPVLQFMAEGGSVSAAARKFACSRKLVTMIVKEAANHVVYDVEEISGEQPVYCISVEETHNFYANEVLNMNCEPRLFAHYSQDPNLLEGYNATPFVDAHQTVANLLNVERDPTAKRMNMGIFTGMQVKSFAGHMNWSVEKATQAWNAWNRAFPGIQDFQNKAKIRLKNRGYVMTLLGRRGRLEDPRFAYRGVSKIIQGSNADIVKWKLLEADRACEDNGDIVQVLMTVHDSYNGQFENTPQARALFEDIVREMAEVQKEPFNLAVPFVLEGEEGNDWCEATFGKGK